MWLWPRVWPWQPQPQPRQKARKATRGEPLLDQHDSVPQFAGGLSIVYYVVSQVNVNNHPECLDVALSETVKCFSRGVNTAETFFFVQKTGHSSRCQSVMKGLTDTAPDVTGDEDD